MFRLTNIPVQKSEKNFWANSSSTISSKFTGRIIEYMQAQMVREVAFEASTRVTPRLSEAAAREFHGFLEELYRIIETGGYVVDDFTISSCVHVEPRYFRRRVELVAVERPRLSALHSGLAPIPSLPARYTVAYVTDLDVAGIPERIR